MICQFWVNYQLKCTQWKPLNCHLKSANEGIWNVKIMTKYKGPLLLSQESKIKSNQPDDMK